MQAFAKTSGLTVTQVWDNRTLLTVSAPVSVIDSVFHVHILRRKRPDGTECYGADVEPRVPASLAAIGMSAVGFDNYAQSVPVVPPAPTSQG